MNSPKEELDKSHATKLEQKEAGDPTHILEGAKTSGDKLTLLEELLVEGNLSRSPFVGDQMLKNSAGLTPQKIIGESVSGTHSVAMDAARSLGPGERTELIARVLDVRPTLTTGELRAACTMLSIDPKPFIDRMVDRKAQRLHETLEQEIQAKQKRQQIVMRLQYEPKEDLLLILKQYEKAFGLTLHQHASPSFRKSYEKLDLDIAMFGRADTPFEELQRIRALVEFERAHREKFKYFLVKPDAVELQDAEEKLKEAEELLEDEDRFEDGDDDDHFYLLIESAKGAVKNYRGNKSAFLDDPFVTLSLIIAIIAALIGLAIGLSVSPLLFFCMLSGLIAFIVVKHLLKTDQIRRRVLESLRGKRFTDSQKRAMAKSASLKNN